MGRHLTKFVQDMAHDGWLAGVDMADYNKVDIFLDLVEVYLHPVIDFVINLIEDLWVDLSKQLVIFVFNSVLVV